MKGSSYIPSISADGRYVAFYSYASNLVPGGGNPLVLRSDAFVHDRQTGVTERVSVGSDGTEGNGDSFVPSISGDGRYVAFASRASNLVSADTNAARDVFVYDRETRVTERVSVGADGAQGSGSSFTYYPGISADGRSVAFQSEFSNLVSGDTNGEIDIFVRDRGAAAGVSGFSASSDDGRVSVSGSATFSGAEVTSALDPPGDGSQGAGATGAELTGASLIYRAEQEDLLVRLRLASLPGPLVAGRPAVLYGLELSLGGTRYEVRALRAAGTAIPPAAPYFALYRCEIACTEQTRLTGGIGTTGYEALVSIPLSALGAKEGAGLTALRAFTALGESASGVVVPFDAADLPDATIPARQVALGIAPAATPEEERVFESEAVLTDANFSGSLDTSSLPPGDYEVWAEACLGETCGSESVVVTLSER